MPEPKRTVPAANFCGTLAANVDNDKMSDADFREFCRNSLPIVIYDEPIMQPADERTS